MTVIDERDGKWLCTADDVADRLRRALTPDEGEHVYSLIEEASLLVLAWLGCPASVTDAWPPAPDAVRVTTSRMVARVIEQAAARITTGAEQFTQQAGVFGQTLRFAPGATSGGPWLAKQDKELLAPFRCAGGIQSIGISSGRTGRYRTREW